MKLLKPHIAIDKICWLFGVTRQAYYQHFNGQIGLSICQELIIKEVIQIRKQHPRMGTKKLHILLEDFMLSHHIKMGRDALFDLLSTYGLLIRRRKRSIHTTQSRHWLKKYSNLIRDFIPTKPNELYVSDITYWKIACGYVYISFITDAYSHKIVGFHVAETLEAIESLQALKMALWDLTITHRLIHHSDRGVQYCSSLYVELLEKHDIQISMTENGDPLENAIAERVNGIMKGEYLDCYTIENLEEATQLLEQVIKLYNEQRPHMSIGNLTPEKVHNGSLKRGEKKWKNYYKTVVA